MAKKDKYELEWEQIKSGNGQQYLQGGTFGSQNGERYFAKGSDVLVNQAKQNKNGLLDNWVQSGSLKDGYQFGDIIKAGLSTVADTGLNVIEGIMSYGEGIGDSINYGIAGVQDLFGQSEKAKQTRQYASEDATSLTMNWLKEKTGINTNSLSADKTDNIAKAVGNALTIWATAGLGEVGQLGKVGSTLLTNGSIFASSMGSGMGEAYKGGATDEEALKYGVISGLAETGSEMLFGGLGRGLNTVGVGKGLSSADDMLAKKVAEKFKSRLGKNLAEFTIKSGAEGLEEVVSGTLQGFGKWITYQKDKDLGEILKDEDLLDSFIAGMVSSGVMQSPGFVKSTKYNKDFITNLSESEQNKVNQMVDDRVNELQREGKDVSDKDITKITEEETEKLFQIEQNIDTFRNNAVNLFPTLDENSRVFYNDLINDISQLMYDTGVNITFDQNLSTLTEWNGDNLIINPTMTDSPIKTLLLKELGTKLISNDGKKTILSYAKENGVYDTLKQQLLATEEYDEANVDNEIVSITLNDLLTNARKTKELLKDENTYETIRNLIEDYSKKYGRDTKDGEFLQKALKNLYGAKGIKDYDKVAINPYNAKNENNKEVEKQTVDNAERSNLSSNKTETKEKPKVESQTEEIVGKEEYKSNEKLPETTKPGTYIEPKTPIKEDTKKGKKFVAKLTGENKIGKELSKNYTSFVDKHNIFQELAEASGNKYLYPKMNNRGMSNGKGQYQIGTAQTDNNGNVIFKSINDIFKPVEDAGLQSEFDEYLAHRLNVERYDKVPVWDESVTPEKSQEIVDEYDKKYPKFKEWADDVYKFNDNQLQKMIDGGLAKENSRDWLYNNYVTISREIGPRTNPLLVNAKGVSINSPIRKAKGSNLEMRPMKEAMARQTLLTERAIADNIAGQELLNVLGGTVGDTKNLLTQTIEGENNALIQNPDGTYNYTVYKNGVPVTMQVTKEVADAIRPTKVKEWESLLPFKAIRGLSTLQRELLTNKNPLFIFTNFFKDIGDAPLNSKYSAGELFANYPKAVGMMLKNSPEWQKYVANGGLSNTYFETTKGEFAQEKSKNKFVKAIQTLNELVEQAPRFTEYLNTLSHGGTLQEALYNSAEITTNFARGGEITKILNRNGFNFLNASVQGFDKQIRNFTRQPGAKGYVQLLTKVALLGVAPALLNNFLLDDDDDYEELPDYVKDNYYLFKTGDNQFIRIPKGRVMSIFGTTARHLVEIGKGNETVKDLVKDTGEQIVNNVAPNNPLENNILSPLISVANNKSWSGGKIVSTTLQNYPDAYQYDEKTTSLAKWLGKTFNYSPKKIDYLLDQYTGGIGDVVMPIMTPYAETKTDNVVENAIVAPFVSKFTVDSTVSNKYVNEYYDVKNELQKEMKTYNSIEDSEESFVKSLQYKYLDKVGDEISALYVEKRNIQNSDLPTSEKYQKARQIQRQIDDIAKFAMEDYQTGYVNDSYASIGDKEFYTKMQNGKLTWAYVDDKTKAKQEEYAQKYDMSPESYYSMDGLTQSTIAGSNIYDFYDMNKKLTQIRDNTTEDKAETFKYINSLNLSIPQKAMYLRTYYNTFNDYNTDIFNYVNSLNMIEDQKKAILIYLGFDYDKKTNTFSWK